MTAKNYSDQKKLSEIIASITRSNSHLQSLIFGGSKGIGKSTAARDITNHLLSDRNDLLHNLLWIDSDDEIITIDQVRQIKEFFSQTIFNDSYRIVVIDNADNLNINSANALLKILEEPPQKSLLILISHQPYNLIDTIKSRCALINFRAPENAHDITKQNTKIEAKESELLLRLAHNIPGIAIYLSQNQGLELYENMIFAISNYDSSYDNTYKFIESYFSDNSVEKWLIFSYLLKYLLEKIIKTSSMAHNNDLFDEEKKVIDKLVAKRSTQDWFVIYDQVLQLTTTTKKLYLDYKNVAIVLIQLINKEA
jgi:DNA polymerase-3 subunit delta'